MTATIQLPIEPAQTVETPTYSERPAGDDACPWTGGACTDGEGCPYC